MAAYAHQIEREFSAQSLSSRGGSGTELGSQYMAESGFYMSSFSAAIFIAALVTVGILMITLLIALTVMLQACENRSKGVVELQNIHSNYEYCQTFALHAELNGLGLDDFPSTCRSLLAKQMTEVQYEKDLTMSLSLVESHFESIVLEGDGLDAILLDIDDIVASFTNDSEHLLSRLDQYNCSKHSEGMKRVKHTQFPRSYTKLQACGWSLILVSRKSNKHRAATIDHLIAAGYKNWSSIIMRDDSEMEMDSYKYFWRLRLALQKQGFRILGVVSSQIDALTYPSSSGRKFKLPNPKLYNLEQRMYIAT